MSQIFLQILLLVPVHLILLLQMPVRMSTLRVLLSGLSTCSLQMLLIFPFFFHEFSITLHPVFHQSFSISQHPKDFAKTFHPCNGIAVPAYLWIDECAYEHHLSHDRLGFHQMVYQQSPTSTFF